MKKDGPAPGPRLLVVIGTSLAVLSGCGGSSNGIDGAAAEAGFDGGSIDAGGGGSDAGTDAASLDAGPPPIPPGCGIQAIELATLGFDGPVPEGFTAATVMSVEPGRLTLQRGDTGSIVLFRFAGPTLQARFAIGLVTQIRRVIDAATGGIVDVVSVAGSTRAAVTFSFAQVLVALPNGATDTNLILSFASACSWEDDRGTCGLPVEDVIRREVIVSEVGGGGSVPLWAGEQAPIGGFTSYVVDAILFPGYAQGACSVGGSSYLGVTFLEGP